MNKVFGKVHELYNAETCCRNATTAASWARLLGVVRRVALPTTTSCAPAIHNVSSRKTRRSTVDITATLSIIRQGRSGLWPAMLANTAIFQLFDSQKEPSVH